MTAASTYTHPPQAYEHVSYWLVFCGARCGAWLSGKPEAWSSTKDRKCAAPFANQDKAWQAALTAGWANIPLPGHDPHQHGPYGPDEHWFRCDNSGAGDCDKARAYKAATMCPTCREGGWLPW